MTPMVTETTTPTSFSMAWIPSARITRCCAFPYPLTAHPNHFPTMKSISYLWLHFLIVGTACLHAQSDEKPLTVENVLCAVQQRWQMLEAREKVRKELE